MTDAERTELERIIKKLHGASQKVRRAQVLPKSDADGLAWIDPMIAEAYGCRTKTIDNIRKRFATESLEVAILGKKRETQPTP